MLKKNFNQIEEFKNLSNKLQDSYQRDVYEIDKMELTTHDKIDLKEEQKGKNDKNIFKIYSIKFVIIIIVALLYFLDSGSVNIENIIFKSLSVTTLGLLLGVTFLSIAIIKLINKNENFNSIYVSTIIETLLNLSFVAFTTLISLGFFIIINDDNRTMQSSLYLGYLLIGEFMIVSLIWWSKEILDINIEDYHRRKEEGK